MKIHSKYLYNNMNQNIQEIYKISNKIYNNSKCMIYKAHNNKKPAILKRYNNLDFYSHETEILDKLLHVNISKIIYKNIYKNFACILMPNYGRSITKLLKTALFTRENIKYYLRQLLEGISYMHNRGVIHCDLSASNVLINRKTHRLTIIDFGEAIYNDNPKLLFTNKLYRAPETRDLCEKIDIWSAGCIFAAMLLKRHLFIRDSDINWNYFTCWPKECGLLSKMLEIDPNKRVSARDALADDYFR